MKKILVFALLFMVTALGSARADLSNPTGLGLSSKSTSITVTWVGTSQEIEGFRVTYYESEDSSTSVTAQIEDPTATGYTITGLTADTKYVVELYVYNGSDESSGTSKSITTTSLDIGVSLVDAGTIEIDVTAYEDTVSTYDVKVGTSPGAEDVYNESGFDVEEKTRIPGLSDGTYYIVVNVLYISGSSGNTGDIEFEVGDYGTFFSKAGDIESGCFIQSSATKAHLPWAVIIVTGLLAGCLFTRCRRMWVPFCVVGLVLTVFSSDAFCRGRVNVDVEYNNLIGIKGGYFDPSESLLGDTYDSIIPASLFYERMFGRYFSMDVSAGFCRAKGNAVTSSGGSTGVDTDLDFIPISASMNLNVPVTNLITFYLGAGGDFWTFEEDFNSSKVKTEVGGYHGKAGVKLFTEDSDYFKRGAILIEASYSVMDRFGDNDVDLGGWTYSLGVMYCF